MFWTKHKNKQKLDSLRAGHDWENLEHCYFPDLDFLDIEDSIADYKRKQAISKEDAGKMRYYSKIYIDPAGRPVRLDQVGLGTIPSETYIEYTTDLPVRASKFRLGFNIHGQRVSKSPELSVQWSYKYDKKGRLLEMVHHSYPDLHFKYGYHNESSRYHFYEYDEEGLFRIWKQNKGLDVDGKRWSDEKVVIYDRKRSQFLSKFTVSKRALVPTSKKNKGAVAFTLGGFPPLIGRDIPSCQKCRKQLSFITSVKLEHPLKNRSSLTSVPIFYCFDCLEDRITIKFPKATETKSLVLDDYDAFPETHLTLVKSTTLDEEPDALVKLGGMPDWIHDEEHPTCAECDNLMVFVSQINSDESIHSGSRVLMFGDVGRLYTFVCCNTVTSIMQCY